MAEDQGRDDTDTTEDDDEDEDDNSTETASGGDWTPPSKEDWERVQRANKRLRRENQKRREAAAQTKNGGSGDGKSDDDAVKKAVAEAVAPIRQGAISTAARLALKAAGVRDEDPDRLDRKLNKLVGMLDMDAIEFEGGSVHGLDDQVDDLQDLYPELFSNGAGGSGGNGKQPPKINGASKKAPAPAKTSSDTLAARITGGRR